MFCFFLFFLIPVIVKSVNICDNECYCQFENKNNHDYIGENVHCAYNNQAILKTEYSLPLTTYSLDLSSCALTHVTPSNLLRSKTMKELILKNNEIEEITLNAFKTPELLLLDLSYNKLSFLDEDLFRSVKKLQSLNLANNRISSFEGVNFNPLSNLKYLNLNNNPMGPSLEEAVLFERKGYGLTSKIKSLSISGINLSRVPDNLFIKAYDIRKLVISNNNLIETFDFPYTLQYLDLSGNPMTELSEEDFSVVPALKELKLNNLFIDEVSDYLFASLRGLTHLELNRNKNLTKFSALAFGTNVLEDSDDFTLESLSLQGSKISELDDRLLEPFGKLVQLDLQGNPWKCDCNLVWVRSLQIESDYYEELRCASPKPLYNAKVFLLDKKLFSCPANKRFVGLTFAIVTFCLVSACIALWLFLFLPRYQYSCNMMRNMYTPVYNLQPLS